MANSINWGKIYDSTYWGVGVTSNTINWGKSYADIAETSVVPSLLSILEARSTYYENEAATTTLLTNLENIDL